MVSQCTKSQVFGTSPDVTNIIPVHKIGVACSHLAKTVFTLFSTRVKMSAYANPFIELAPVLDATP